MKARRRIYGKPVNLRSLKTEPINEHGVIYLFGVYHDIFGFEIESIQAGFPDCIARRKKSDERREEVRIEFEFDSLSFKKHKHDPDGVDVIVCWKHNWKNLPKGIEVIELSSRVAEKIKEDVSDDPKKLSAYQEFARIKRLEGLTFTDISKLWIAEKNKIEKTKKPAYKDQGSWKEFCKIKRKEGLTFKEISELWNEVK